MPIQDRRRLLQWGLAAALPAGTALRSAAAIPASATPPRRLRVLAWPGYAEPELVQAFERAQGVQVELTIIDTDEAMWAQAGRGESFDVLALNTAELQRYRRADRVLELDLAQIPNARRQLPRFRDRRAIPGLVHEGRSFAMPYTYAEMGLIYDRRQLVKPPDSVSALWDPRWQGKVLGYDGAAHKVSLAAQRLGLKSPFRLAERDWAPVGEQLISLRRNVLGFYQGPEESVELFRRHQAALMFANYGSQQLRLLRAAGSDVGYTIPREGAMAWLDCWAILRGCRDLGLAHAWIDHQLSELAARLLVERQGLASTLHESDAPPGRLIWLEPVEDAGRRERLWAAVRAGRRQIDTRPS